MAVTLADGQVAASATEVLSGATSGDCKLTASFANTSSSEQTLVVTLARGSNTARRIARAVLGQHEMLVLDGLGFSAGDSLLATTTDASSVDYVVARAGDGPYAMRVFDAEGIEKNISGILEQLLILFG